MSGENQMSSLSNRDIPFEESIVDPIDEFFIQLKVQSCWIAWTGTL